MKIFGQRLWRMVRHNPKQKHILFLPLGLPIALVAVLLILVGYQVTALKPYYLLKAYERILAKSKVKHSNSDSTRRAWLGRVADRQG